MGLIPARQRFPSVLSTLPTSALVLVAANLVPLVGVAFFDWDLATILVLYWIESGVVGLLNIPKMLLARGPLRVEARGLAVVLPMSLDGFAGVATRAFLAVFFVIHYGIFWAVHGVFVFLLPSFQRSREGLPASSDGVDMAVIISAAALLLASHLGSFVVNFIGHREYLSVSPIQQMFAPYSRVVVMHLTILFGAFLAIMLGAPVWTMVVMVSVKTGIDLRLHAREHARTATPKNGDISGLTADATCVAGRLGVSVWKQSKPSADSGR
jgi:Family of unknown function (DUF6498)